jgi:L-arabinose isomerase
MQQTSAILRELAGIRKTLREVVKQQKAIVRQLNARESLSAEIKVDDECLTPERIKEYAMSLPEKKD